MTLIILGVIVVVILLLIVALTVFLLSKKKNTTFAELPVSQFNKGGGSGSTPPSLSEEESYLTNLYTMLTDTTSKNPAKEVALYYQATFQSIQEDKGKFKLIFIPKGVYHNYIHKVEWFTKPSPTPNCLRISFKTAAAARSFSPFHPFNILIYQQVIGFLLHYFLTDPNSNFYLNYCSFNYKQRTSIEVAPENIDFTIAIDEIDAKKYNETVVYIVPRLDCKNRMSMHWLSGEMPTRDHNFVNNINGIRTRIATLIRRSFEDEINLNKKQKYIGFREVDLENINHLHNPTLEKNKTEDSFYRAANGNGEFIYSNSHWTVLLDILPNWNAQGYCLIIPIRQGIIRVRDIYKSSEAINTFCEILLLTINSLQRYYNQYYPDTYTHPEEINFSIGWNDGPKAHRTVDRLHLHVIPRPSSPTPTHTHNNGAFSFRDWLKVW